MTVQADSFVEYFDKYPGVVYNKLMCDAHNHQRTAVNRDFQRLFVTTSKSLIPYLARELTQKGFSLDSVSPSGISLMADIPAVMRLNLQLRTAHHILYHLKDFACTTADVLYANVFSIPWEDIVDVNTYVSVHSHTATESIRDSRFANLKCKDAIVDRMAEKLGRRPDTGPSKNGLVVALYWKDAQASLYIDTSGESLTKRGYRKIPWKAPLPETLAAGIIFESQWSPQTHFINPMCGSGTLAIEAALMGLQRAPGLLRNCFSLQFSKVFSPNLWRTIRDTLSTEADPSFAGKIIASDNDPDAVEAARKNARTAGVEQHIEFVVCEYDQTPIPQGPGVVIMNPDYGKRLGQEDDLENLYKNIGSFLKHRCSGYRGFVFTGNPLLAKKIGLRSAKKTEFQHADITCRLHEYELYEGSRSEERRRVQE